MNCIGGVVYNCGNISGWPPLPYPLFSSPPQQPPQQPPPNPPPPRAYVETSYYLSFPPFVGANVSVFWTALNDYILPSPKPIALQWQYFPTRYARPRILTTTTNPRIYTSLKPIVDDFGSVYVDTDPGIPNPPNPLIVMQFLYHDRRWIVVCHEVYFPPVPLPWDGATPNDYRLALQNREEKLVVFYDSALEGLGSFTHRHLTIQLTPKEAFIQYTFQPFPDYYIQPSDNNAYCMFIDPLRRGEA
jgi:hypothetical protein